MSNSSMEFSESESSSPPSSSSSISAISIGSKDSGISSNATSEDRLNFQLRSHIKEKRAQKLWAIEFNNFLREDQPKIFAVLGGVQFSIYECSETDNIKFLMCFADPDSKEDFWSCCWSQNPATHRSILITGGARGVIQLIEPESEQWNLKTDARHLIGHGSAINQLKVVPQKPYLLASASSDRSIRLWNIVTMVCIASFHGEHGHRDDVVSIDLNRDYTKLLSGGTDHMVCIWDLTVPNVAAAIEKSRNYDGTHEKYGFKTVLHMFPIYQSRQLHCNYVDCVQWMNELILSKSNNDDLCCWSPRISRNGKYSTRKLNEYDIFTYFDTDEKCDYYFMRFATDTANSLMALGNNDGDVYIWDLKTDDPNKIPRKVLQHPNRTGTARHVSFSRNGQHLVVCCDNGSIWHYQRQPMQRAK